MYVENNFTRLNYDPCSYKEQLKRATAPGLYMVNTPGNDCRECSQDVPADPFLRYQKYGAAMCPPGKAVDDSSELKGLNYPNSHCMTDMYLPGKYAAKGQCEPKGNATAYACNLQRPTEQTRLSNNPCNLRGTGINRWEWLCYDPQEYAIIPFEHLVNERLVTKDNHVPCLENPMDQSGFFPSQKNNDFNPAWKPCQSMDSVTNQMASYYPYSAQSFIPCKDIDKL